MSKNRLTVTVVKKKEYKTLVSDIAELLLRHDPIGLKAATDLPIDEYEAEAMAIAGGLRHCHDGDSCLALVVKIFRDSFGEAIAGPEEIYRPLAAEVWDRFRTDL